MPGCVLHVVGESFEPEEVLADLSLRPYAVFRKGEKRFANNSRKKQVHAAGGFKCDVSAVDDDFAGQVKDAIAFLRRYHDDLLRLASIAAIESKYLDFGYGCRLDHEHCCLQCDYLPPELLRLCGELGIGIELSLYPRFEEGE